MAESLVTMSRDPRFPAITKSGIVIGKSFDGKLPRLSDGDLKLQSALLHAAKTQRQSIWLKITQQVRTFLS